ncbi:MAG: urate hydroxylase PuuD [Candidatus Acidoferrales bacterium]
MDATPLAAILQADALLPDSAMPHVQMALRWIHLLAGITWIGLLYFFNLVSIPVAPTLDPATRSTVMTTLVPRALWWFRWGAVVTVLAGFIYWVLLLKDEPQNGGTPGQYLWRTLGIWFALVIVTWAIQYFLLLAPPLTRHVWLYVILVLLVVGAMGHFIMQFIPYPGASSRVLSIAVGGGIGFIMLLNVWGIVWRAQKRLIAWTRESAEKGTAMPPQAEVLARQVRAASRANAWLSIPMLFFMAAASHYPFLGG